MGTLIGLFLSLLAYAFWLQFFAPKPDLSPSNIDRVICRGEGINSFTLENGWGTSYVFCADGSDYYLKTEDLEEIILNHATKSNKGVN